MIDSETLTRFQDQIETLKFVASEANKRTLSDPVDKLFFDNSNVFIKSFVVSACSIVEAFIQELVFQYINVQQGRLSTANIPRNLIFWSVPAEVKSEHEGWGRFEIALPRRSIEEIVSANPHKTIKVFAQAGVDIKNCDEFMSMKDRVASIVSKRNTIVHHNDDASDVSFSDVIGFLDDLDYYMSGIFQFVCIDSHLQSEAV